MTVSASSARRAPKGGRRAAPKGRRAATGSRAPKRGRRAPKKAGRNLPAAIAVGLLLGGAVVASLLVVREAYVAVVTVASVVGVVELGRSLGAGRLSVPLPPAVLAALLLPATAYFLGPSHLAAAFLGSVAAVLVWTGAFGLQGSYTDAAAGVFVVSYVPLLASFTALMLRDEELGPRLVLTLIILAVCSDTGGYVVGVLFGKHPMAPSASPKKSWEGFIGSVAGCLVAGVACAMYLLGHLPWLGLVLGTTVVFTATVGDLVESIVKRDLGVKDMGHMLPGHGGLMDRLDSLLLTAPALWIAYTLLLNSGAA